MTASIVLSNLTLSTPDDRLLLQDIDLRLGSERTGLVGRNGVGKTTLLQFISGERRPRSGTVLVSGTIGNFRQFVQVEPRETIADLFGAARTLEVLRRADLGQATADELAQVDWTLEGRLNASLQ
ncbi:ATP-binding cassette domain-containing protein, partial [Rhizobiaceae sp. 2RAB30]